MVRSPLPRRRAIIAILGAAAMLPRGARAQAAPAGAPLARIGLAVPGVTMEVLSLARLANHPVVELRFSLVNGAQRPVSLGDLGMTANDPGLIGGLQLLDLPNGVGYPIGRVSSRNLASTLPGTSYTIAAGDRRDGLWAWFGAPPTAVTRVALHVPGAAPVVDLPISAP